MEIEKKSNEEVQEPRFDPYRAARQFERMMGPGFDINSPGEERMTPDEYREHKHRQRQLQDRIDHMPEGELICTITYNLKEKTVKYHWPETGETLVEPL